MEKGKRKNSAEKIFFLYPFQVLHGIKSMKGNAMAIELNDRPGFSRDLFLNSLMPVKTHLYNFIRKSTNFSPDADDLFQDTLLKGFRYFHSFDRNKSFKTWIFTIAHNLLKDHVRSVNVLLKDPLPLEYAAEKNIDGLDAATADDIREIYAIAARLKPRQREVFFLYYYNEFTVSEIVEITGISRASVKFTLHQARSAIKKIVEVPS
jgi:RNA polymerase sigma-70 factor (ECF subfamily)